MLQRLPYGRINDTFLTSQDVDDISRQEMHEGEDDHGEDEQDRDEIEDTVYGIDEHGSAYSIQAVRMPPPRVLKAPETEG